MSNKIEYRYLSNGNAGQNFNIYVSNASFETISYLDNIYRNTTSSYVNSQNNVNNNGLGTNIANSIIICASDVVDKSSTYRILTYTDFKDQNNNGKYDKDVDNTLETYAAPIERINVAYGYRDTGNYDIAITDTYGHPIVLTPPFNDINKKYFSTQLADGSLSYKGISYRGLNYPTSMLTLSYDFAKQFDSVGKVVEDMDLTYTPIVKHTYSYTLNDTGQKVINEKKTWKLAYYTRNGDNAKVWIVYDPENAENTLPKDLQANKGWNQPQTVEPEFTHSLRFCDAIDEIADLQAKLDESNTKSLISDLKKRVKTLEDQVQTLLKLNFILSKNYNTEDHKDAPYTYIWTGTSTEYNTNVTESDKSNPNITFLINQDKNQNK